MSAAVGMRLRPDAGGGERAGCAGSREGLFRLAASSSETSTHPVNA